MKIRLVFMGMILLSSHCQNSGLHSRFNDQFTTDGFLAALGKDVAQQNLNNWFKLSTNEKDSITGLSGTVNVGISFAASTDRFNNANGATNFTNAATNITYGTNLGSPLAGGDRFSVTAWVRRNATGNVSAIANTMTAGCGPSTGYRLIITALSALQFEVGGVATCQIVSPSATMPTGSWIFLAFTVLNEGGNATYTLYWGDHGKNNLQSLTSTVSNSQPFNTTDSFHINPLESDIEDLMFYTDVLTELQIWQNYVTTRQE